MYQWLLNILQQKAAREAAKERCGVYPFQLPHWFPLTECCAPHDVGYTMLRLEAVTIVVREGIDLSKQATAEQFLAPYEQRILDIDTMFTNCLRNRSTLLTKPLAKIFIRIVEQAGWSVWYQGTVDDYEQMVIALQAEDTSLV